MTEKEKDAPKEQHILCADGTRFDYNERLANHPSCHVEDGPVPPDKKPEAKKADEAKASK